MVKAHVRRYASRRGSRDAKPVDLVRTDDCGPFPVPSIGGSRYFVVFRGRFDSVRIDLCDAVEV